MDTPWNTCSAEPQKRTACRGNRSSHKGWCPRAAISWLINHLTIATSTITGSYPQLYPTIIKWNWLHMWFLVDDGWWVAVWLDPPSLGILLGNWSPHPCLRGSPLVSRSLSQSWKSAAILDQLFHSYYDSDWCFWLMLVSVVKCNNSLSSRRLVYALLLNQSEHLTTASCGSPGYIGLNLWILEYQSWSTWWFDCHLLLSPMNLGWLINLRRMASNQLTTNSGGYNHQLIIKKLLSLSISYSMLWWFVGFPTVLLDFFQLTNHSAYPHTICPAWLEPHRPRGSSYRSHRFSAPRTRGPVMRCSQDLLRTKICKTLINTGAYGAWRGRRRWGFGGFFGDSRGCWPFGSA